VIAVGWLLLLFSARSPGELAGVEVNERGRRGTVPSKGAVVTQQLGALGEDVKQLWVAVAADPKKQARKQRVWTIVSGIIGAAATILARRGASRLWAILTGEQPPAARKR
jgi:hypothetical protein